jgi:serine/threonine protein kinase
VPEPPGEGAVAAKHPPLVDTAPELVSPAEIQWRTGDVILDLYEIRDVYESGGMGLVFRAYHRAWDMELAIKSPRPEVFRTRLQKESFVFECEAWTRLGLHPNTVACYYVRTIDQIPRVFAEFIDGGNLQQWIETRKLYSGSAELILERILDVAIQFAWGLDHAHRNRLVHQDVKPSNVMMTSTGVAKVTDFGLSRARQSLGEVTSQHTDARAILVSSGGSTPAYRSPEQAAHEKLSLRTDLWSWAVSVLEMFNGDISWTDGQIADEALAAYLRRGPAAGDIPAMPVAIAEMLRRCLQRLPDYRPSGMAEICRGLMEAYGQVVGMPYARTHIVEALAGDEPDIGLGPGADISNRALSLHDLGRTEEALDLLQQHLAGNPYDPLPWCSQAALEIRLKRAGVAEVARRFTETILPVRPRWSDLGIDPGRLLGYMASHFAAGHSQAILDLHWLESPTELVSAAVDGTIVRWAAGRGGWVVQQRIGAVREGMSASLICPRSDTMFLGFENGNIEQRVLSTGDVLGVLNLGAAAKDRGQVVPQSGKPVSRAVAGIVRLHGSDDLRVYLRSPDDFLISLSDWNILDAQHLPRTLTIKAAAPDDGRFVALAEEWGLVHISRDGWI